MMGFRIAVFILAISAVGTAGRADTVAAAPSASADTALADTAPGWVWSGMEQVDAPASPHGGTAHAGGPGSYGAYTFSGTGVDVYAMLGPVIEADGRTHRMGKLKVSIDGSLKADPSLFRPQDNDADLDAFTINGLNPGNHVLQVEPDGGWAAVEYIQVRDSSSSDGASGDGGSTGTQSGSGGAGAAPNGGGQSGAAHKGDKSGPAQAPSSGIPGGQVISLIAGSNHLYVTADQNPNAPLIASGTSVSTAQKFEVEDVGDGFVALKSMASGLYIAVSPTDNKLYPARQDLDKSVAGGEIFQWTNNPDGTVTLRSYSTGKYLTVDATADSGPPGSMVANRLSASSWEKFKVTQSGM